MTPIQNSEGVPSQMLCSTPAAPSTAIRSIMRASCSVKSTAHVSQHPAQRVQCGQCGSRNSGARPCHRSGGRAYCERQREEKHGLGVR